MSVELLECSVGNCWRQPIATDGEEFLCERHMPDPNVRSWAEMRAEGIEVETMGDYWAEVRGFGDHYGEPSDPMEDWLEEPDLIPTRTELDTGLDRLTKCVCIARHRRKRHESDLGSGAATQEIPRG